MWMLVSRARVKQSLRIDASDDDALLDFVISAASRRIAKHLKGQAGELLSVDSPPNSPPDSLDVVPEHIQAAVIYLTGIMYRSPDNDTEEAFGENRLPLPVLAMLSMDRDPTLA